MCSRLLSFCKKRGHCYTNNGIPRKHNAAGILLQSHRAAVSFHISRQILEQCTGPFPFNYCTKPDHSEITKRSFRDHFEITQRSIRGHSEIIQRSPRDHLDITQGSLRDHPDITNQGRARYSQRKFNFRESQTLDFQFSSKMYTVSYTELSVIARYQ